MEEKSKEIEFKEILNNYKKDNFIELLNKKLYDFLYQIFLHHQYLYLMHKL